MPVGDPPQTFLGYTGQSFLDAGYFFTPYVPLTVTPPMLDPNSFNALADTYLYRTYSLGVDWSGESDTSPNVEKPPVNWRKEGF